MYKKDTYRLAVCNGIKMKINLRHYNDHLTYWYFQNGLLLKNIIDVIELEDIVIDVGVNIGYYFLNFANKANKEFVHSFEPNQEVFGYWTTNCDPKLFSKYY